MPSWPSSGIWRWSASCLALGAFVFFCWHGVWRGFSGGYDLAMLYAGTAAWSDGADPYVLQEAAQAMASRGGQLDPTSIVLYPPSAFPVFAPVAWLGWKAARVAWVVAQVFACVGLASGLQKMGGDRLRQGFAGWLLIMALLLWWPIHTGFFVGQVALPVAALTVWAVLRAEAGSRWWAGLLLGLALALKPQLAAAGLPVLLLRGRWAAALGSLVIAGSFFTLGVWRLAGGAWLAHWQANLHAFSHGGYGDVALPWARAQMVQFSALFAALRVAGAVALGAAAAAFIGCFWLVRHWPERKGMDALEVLAAVSLVVLLAGYHRSYDAVLALVPLAHGLRLIARDPRHVAGWWVAGALAVFLTPGGALLAPLSPAGAWWVQAQTLGLLAAAVGLCIAPRKAVPSA